MWSKVPQRNIFLIIFFVSENLSVEKGVKCYMWHLCRYLRKPGLECAPFTVPYGLFNCSRGLLSHGHKLLYLWKLFFSADWSQMINCSAPRYLKFLCCAQGDFYTWSWFDGNCNGAGNSIDQIKTKSSGTLILFPSSLLMNDCHLPGPEKMFISLQAGQNFPPAQRISLQFGMVSLTCFCIFSLPITKFPGKKLPVCRFVFLFVLVCLFVCSSGLAIFLTHSELSILWIKHDIIHCICRMIKIYPKKWSYQVVKLVVSTMENSFQTLLIQHSG